MPKIHDKTNNKDLKPRLLELKPQQNRIITTPLRPAKAQIKQELCIYQFVIKRLLLDYYTTKKPQKQGNSEYNYEFCEL